jgi:hypothetical protein
MYIYIYILGSSAALRAALIPPCSSTQISGLITVAENQTDRNTHKQGEFQHTHLNTLKQGFWIKWGRAESSSSFESAPRPHSFGAQAISKRRKKLRSAPRPVGFGTQAVSTESKTKEALSVKWTWEFSKGQLNSEWILIHFCPFVPKSCIVLSRWKR